MRRLFALSITAFVASCGGENPPPRTPIAVAGEPYPTVAKPVARTTEPYRNVTILTRYFRTGSQHCGNGPFAMEIEVPPVKWGAEVKVFVYGTKFTPGHVEIESRLGSHEAWYYTPGEADPRCHARGGELSAPIADGAVGSGGAPKGGRAPGLQKASEPVRLDGLAVRPAIPNGATRRLLGGVFLGARKEMEGEVPDFRGGCFRSHRGYPVGTAVARVWYPTVQDLEGAVYEVVIEEIAPTVSDAEFVAQLAQKAADDRATVAARADECKVKPQDPRCFVGCLTANDASGRTTGSAWNPPPPPQAEVRPPRPSPGAEWIAGSWGWNGTSYQWDAGFWRVGDGREVAASAIGKLAPETPNLPPPNVPPRVARVEAVPPAPAIGVVWVPGYWIWTGYGWAWTTGMWHVPPMPHAHWVPPIVRVGPGSRGGRWIVR